MHQGTNTAEPKSRVVAYEGKPANVAGLAEGTTVMTLRGEIPVQDLSAGERIITRDSGMATLKAVKTADVTMSCIQIKAGSLGHTRPNEDMIVGPDTLVHIRDWRAKALFGADVATVKARRLIDGEFVSKQPTRSVRVFELVFDRQHILYADGLEVASAPV